MKINQDFSLSWIGHATFRVKTPGGKTILVDPWLEENPSCPVSEKKQSGVDLILLTHGHFDHSLGMEKVDGKIYINLDDEFLARNPQEQLSAFTNSELEVQEYTGELNDIFTYKNENIIIYSNPGHTKGSVSYEFKNLGVVFTGDFVFAEGIGRTDLYSGNTSEMKESLNNIFLTFNKDLEVFPGHGNTDTVKNILNYNSYLKEFING